MPAVPRRTADDLVLRERGVLGRRLHGLCHAHGGVAGPRSSQRGEGARADRPALEDGGRTLRPGGLLDRPGPEADPRSLARARAPAGRLLRAGLATVRKGLVGLAPRVALVIV